MEINYDVIGDILLSFTGFFVLYYFFYKRYIYSIFDPIFIYIFTLSFSSVLVTYTLADRPYYLIHYFLCHAFLFAGFATTINWLKPYEQHIPAIRSTTQFDDYKILTLIVYILFGIYVLANIILFYSTGFALLSDDPTISKVENFTKGYGIIRKINFSIGSFLTAGLLFLLLSKARRVDVILLIVVIILTGLEGSKSSLLRILISFMLLANHKLFQNKRDIISKFKFLIPIGVVMLFSVFFVVLFKETEDGEQALFAFIRRLLYGADSTLYFYTPVNEQYFAQFRFWDYPKFFFNQILGFLRIVTSEEAFGNVMVANVFPNMTGTIVGPNTSYYIEGQIFFGYYGAFIYSSVVGGCYAFIRQYFFQTTYYSAFWVVLICCICQQASALTIEVTLSITQMFDTLFFVMPVYIFVNLAITGETEVPEAPFLIIMNTYALSQHVRQVKNTAVKESQEYKSDDVHISVCMASYNGAKFIEKQIRSILVQLNINDELIISDDSSTDDTLEIIKSFKDERIYLLKNCQFRSAAFNFENALKQARGKFIFLADQDDIWKPNKIVRMLEVLDQQDLVISDCNFINDADEVIGFSCFKLYNSGPGVIKNFVKNSYLGNCMAFNRRVLNSVLPFPEQLKITGRYLLFHDVWIGLIANMNFRVKFIPDVLSSYRRHNANASPTEMNAKSPNSLVVRFKSRWLLLIALLNRIFNRA